MISYMLYIIHTETLKFYKSPNCINWQPKAAIVSEMVCICINKPNRFAYVIVVLLFATELNRQTCFINKHRRKEIDMKKKGNLLKDTVMYLCNFRT